MIKSLIDYANELEVDWSKKDHPQKTLSYLTNFNVNQSLPEFELEVANWLKKSKLPKQVNLYNNFGEPSLTLFNNGKFAIDVYFWRKNDTIIHSHGFRGAFKVLYGLSLHEKFKIEDLELFEADIKKTKLVNTDIKILKQGDAHIIDSDLVHRVVHLDNPTVTLCIRTVEDIELNQWHHLPIGLSFQKKNLTNQIIKQVLYFQYLLGSSESAAYLFLDKILDSLDSSSKISLYESLCYREIGLDDKAFRIIDRKFELVFKNKKWFNLYKSYYEKLAQNLQENFAQSKETKLLAHLINSDYSKAKAESLISRFSNQQLASLCQEIINNTAMFNPQFEDIQKSKLTSYMLG